MATMGSPVSTRLTDDQRERIQQYAADRDISQSKALAELAEAGLEVSGDTPDGLDARDDLEELLYLAERADDLAADDSNDEPERVSFQ